MDKKLISVILGAIAVLGGLIVMAGWTFDVPALKSILPGWVTMKFITAFSFVLSGILVVMLAKKEKEEISKTIILVASFALLLLMITFIISLFFGVSTGIENLFVKEAEGAVKTTVPGVPAIPTMICFILVALSGVFFTFNPKQIFGSFWLGILTSVIGGIAILGYLFNMPVLYYTFTGYTSMAFHTAILFVLLGAGLMLLKENAE